MNKTTSRLLTALLSAGMMSSLLTGCSSTTSESTTNESSTGIETEVEASEYIIMTLSSVEYDQSGKYTTTLESMDKEVDLSNLSADDVKVSYQAEIIKNTITDSDSQDEEITQSESMEEVDCEVTDFTVDGNSFTLSFTDPNALENLTGQYVVEISSKSLAGSVFIDYIDYTLSTDTEYVIGNSDSNLITLSVDDGAFLNDLIKADISLEGSFSEMEIEDFSVSDNNLTLNLKGAPVVNEVAGSYLDGNIIIGRTALKAADVEAEISIPVIYQAIYTDESDFKMEDGHFIIPLIINDPAVVEALQADQIHFESGLAIAGISKDGTLVEIAVDLDAATLNEAAQILNGQALVINDEQIEISLPSASFYPVFDYMEAVDGGYDLTFNLFSLDGTFSEDISAGSVSYEDDLENATTISLDRISDDEVQLVLSIKTDVDKEELNLQGAFNLAAGSLVNKWNEPVNETISFSRIITYDTLGKDATDAVNTIAGATQAAEAVSKFASISKVFDTVKTVAGGISGVVGAATAIKTILEMTGAIKSNMAIVQEQLAEINAKLDAIQSTLSYQSNLLNEIGEIQLKNQLDSFFSYLDKLNVYNEIIAGIYYKATNNLTTTDYYLWTSEITQQDAAASPKKFVDVQPTTDQGWADYLTALNTAIEAQEAARASSYKTFTSDMRTLIDAYEYVADKVSTDLNNALDSYDQLCTKSYNFDTIAKPYRMNFRTKIQFLLAQAVSLIADYYNCDNPAEDPNPELIERLNLYTNAMNKFNAKAIKDEASKNGFERTLCYTNGSVYTKVYYAFKGSSQNDFQNRIHAVIYVADTFTGYTDTMPEFTDDQITEFERRLKSTGKTNTLAQELELAGITNITQSMVPNSLWNKTIFSDYANLKPVGMAFQTRRKQGSLKGGVTTYWQHIMVKTMNFDSSKVEEIEIGAYYPGSFLGGGGASYKETVALWVTSVFNFAKQG